MDSTLIEPEEGELNKRIEMLQKIGKGSFGEVWIARLLDTTAPDQIKYVATKTELKSSTNNALKTEF